jgi:energy-coupling factor transport system permease protein
LVGKFIFGQYKPSSSLGHRLDPRGKILYAVFLMILSLFTASVSYYAIIIAGIIFLLLLSNISFITLIKTGKPFIFLVLITAIYHLIFSARDTRTVVDIFGFRLTEGGIYMAAAFSLRVLVFVGVAFFISLTTLPSDMAEVLVGWMKPLKRLGVPVNDIGLIVFIAMRFIPVLAEEFDTLRKAQLVRGVDFSGGLIKKSRKMIFLLIPIFQSAIRRADDLALAIEARGYSGGAERSSYRQFAYRLTDLIFFTVAVVFAVLSFIFAGA